MSYNIGMSDSYLSRNIADSVYKKYIDDILFPSYPFSHDDCWRDASSERTGNAMKSISMVTTIYNLVDGRMPILTTRQVPFKSAMVELEGFIKGITSKQWYIDRGCHFWDYWCNPEKVPYSTDPEIQKLMKEEDDLGLIYGYQWRNFSDPELPDNSVDQLSILVNKLRNKTYDRRLRVSAWNPLAFDKMALVPCHTEFNVFVSADWKYMDLSFNMRSNDLALGYPNNQVFYAVLLILLAKEAGCTPRYLKHDIVDLHIYENQVDVLVEQMKNRSYIPPKWKLKDGDFDIFEWKSTDIELINYEHAGKIKMPFPAI